MGSRSRFRRAPKALYSSPPSKTRKPKQRREEYDPTPLAVIRILGEIQTESNVAGWIRTGGLWGRYPPQPSLRPPSLSHLHPLHLRPLSGNDAPIEFPVTQNQDQATATDGEGNAEGEGETDVVQPQADPAILGSEREKCAG